MLDELKKNSFEINGMFYITPKKALPFLQQGISLVDLRPLSESTFKMPKVERLMLLPYPDFDEHMEEIPKDRPVIIGDAVGIQTKIAYQKLLAHGYTNIVAMAGGFVDWERDGLPMEENVQQRLSGACVCQLKPRERK